MKMVSLNYFLKKRLSTTSGTCFATASNNPSYFICAKVTTTSGSTFDLTRVAM